jgi:anthranilate phosphoribosyltransferase
MLGEVPEAQTAGLLVALRSRPPDAPTLSACARALRAHRLAVHPEVRPLVDTCGTGGDGAGTFNISTTAAFVVAGAGGAVAKHGNRSVTSKSGSADVLEALGCTLDVGPDGARRLLDATGFAFLFAPVFHPAMAHVGPVRRALRIRTIFNLLGPLANPALAERQLLGVYDASLTEVIAEALRELGSERAVVVHCEGLDEIGLHAVTRGHRLQDGRVGPFSLDPGDFGFRRAPLAAIGGGDARTNSGITRSVLSGQPGAPLDVVVLNSAAAIEVAGLAPTFAEALERARDAIASGKALQVLDRYIESSRRLAPGGPR